ncbi:unnamed protein product [Amoebophrya sp. A120]|nr:unnamed protein product [Amoebophrya sp. A120]|eukprot:GSA120T00024513001.1
MFQPFIPATGTSSSSSSTASFPIPAAPSTYSSDVFVLSATTAFSAAAHGGSALYSNADIASSRAYSTAEIVHDPKKSHTTNPVVREVQKNSFREIIDEQNPNFHFEGQHQTTLLTPDEEKQLLEEEIQELEQSLEFTKNEISRLEQGIADLKQQHEARMKKLVQEQRRRKQKRQKNREELNLDFEINTESLYRNDEKTASYGTSSTNANSGTGNIESETATTPTGGGTSTGEDTAEDIAVAEEQNGKLLDLRRGCVDLLQALSSGINIEEGPGGMHALLEKYECLVEEMR